MGKGFGIISLVLTIFLNSGCFNPDKEAIANLSNGNILIFGHGGAGMGIVNTPNPPNSEESILSAIDFHGADGVEIDIQILKDSVIVAYHDKDLRTQTNCSGCLQGKNLEDISNCRFRRNFVASDQGSTLITLEKILDHFSERAIQPKLSLNVHLHRDCLAYESWSEYDRAMVHALAKLISEREASSWVWIESENIEFLKGLRLTDSTIHTFLIQPISALSVQEASIAGCTGMVCDLGDTREEDIALARSNDLLISLFNANIRKDLKKAIRLLPDFIQTDNIILAKQLLSD